MLLGAPRLRIERAAVEQDREEGAREDVYHLGAGGGGGPFVGLVEAVLVTLSGPLGAFAVVRVQGVLRALARKTSRSRPLGTSAPWQPLDVTRTRRSPMNGHIEGPGALGLAVHHDVDGMGARRGTRVVCTASEIRVCGSTSPPGGSRTRFSLSTFGAVRHLVRRAIAHRARPEVPAGQSLVIWPRTRLPRQMYARQR